MPHLSALSLALNRPGAVSLEQVVASLFAAGEQGAWYDPSAANVTWRRNLLTYTEQFDNAAWTKTGIKAFGSGSTANAIVAPDGTTTADLITQDASTGQHKAQTATQTLPSTGEPFVVSCYAKAGTATRICLYTYGTSKGLGVDLSTGQQFTVVGLTNVLPANVFIQAVPNYAGWYRIGFKDVVVGSFSVAVFIVGGSNNENFSYTGDDSSGLYVWGTQLERGEAATAYQRIVTPEITYLADVQSQPLLFTDAAGTTPVVGVESPVGLILDKRKGLVLGSELTPAFSSWTLQASWSLSAGKLTCSGGLFDYAYVNVPTLDTAKWYKFTFVISQLSAGTVRIGLGTLGSQPYADITAVGTYTYYWVPTSGGTNNIWAQCRTASQSITIDSISVKLLDGNHAYQTGSTARPVLRARYNLLEYSEQFDNAYWTRAALNAFGSGSVVNTTATTDPIGGNTAEFIQEDTALTTTHGINRSVTITANATYTLTCHFKAATRSIAILGMDSAGGNGARSYFDLSSTGSVGTNAALGTGTLVSTPTITSLGNGWFRCQITAKVDPAATTAVLRLSMSTADNTPTYTGNGTSGLYIWGVDLRVGTSAGDYQRIAAATDYATTSTITGQPFRPYLAFDGSDDFLQAGVTQSAYPLTLAAGIENLAASSVGGIMSLAASDSVYKTLRHTGVNGNDVNDREAANTTTSTVTVAGRKFALGQFETSAMTVEINTTNTQTAANTNAFGSLTTLFLGKVRPSGLISESKIYGALAINRVLTAGEKSATQSYMASKMGVTL